MASRRADWTFGGVRLISSASKIFVKIGPFRISNPPLLGRKISAPIRSDGKRSLVKEMRLFSREKDFASARIVRVFPRPGVPSRSACPPVNTVIINFSSKSSCPRIAFWRFFLREFIASEMWISASFIFLKNYTEKKFFATKIVKSFFVVFFDKNLQNVIE